jgi:hypothetical protein
VISGFDVNRMFRKRNSGFISSAVCLIIFSICTVLISWIIDFYTDWTILKISEFKELGNLATFDLRSDLYTSLYISDSEGSEFDEDIAINENKLFLQDKEIMIMKGVSDE